MTDAEHEAQVQRLSALLDKWIPMFGLERWHVTRAFHRGPIPHHEEALGTCTPDWRYEMVFLNFNTDEAAETADDRMEWVVVHELAHVIASRMRGPDNAVTDNEELVATQIATALIEAFRAGKASEVER